MNKTLILKDAKNKGYQIETVPCQWPFDYDGNEAFVITNLEMKRAYLCFCKLTGKLIAKNRIS